MYLCDANGDPYNAETFDYQEYLVETVPDPRMLEYPEGRRALTQYDPLLFSVIYGHMLLKDTEGKVSFGDLHLDLCRKAIDWTLPLQPAESRHVFVAGRGNGKSTWTFKLLPMWAACHGHRKFVAAFSDSATQAQKHLMGWKQLMDSSPLLREDYPEVCEPKRRPNGNAVADNQELYEAKSGFTFSAKGIDTGVLGLTNSENVRPDCLLLDDIEKDEANYSIYQAQQRLTTVLDTVLPMNPRAAIFFVGTVTMPGSIVHELVKSVVYPADPTPQWISSQKFQVHYIKPIETNADGSERSSWPQVFPLQFFKDMEHTREYKKNYLNLPVAIGDEYWDDSDFIYETLPDAPRVLLQIDPAVTSKRGSDYTAFAVIAYQPPSSNSVNGELVVEKAKCEVRDIVGVKLPPEKLRSLAMKLIAKYPEIGAIRIEVNQGGDTWRSVFHDMPVKVLVHRESIPKKVRAQNLLNHYQRGRVVHRIPFRDLEDQMKSFPNVHHDDLIDAVGAGVYYFFKKKVRLEAKSVNYTNR